MMTQRTAISRELATLGPPLLLLLAVLQFATSRGAGHQDLLLAGLTVAGTQVLPGLLVWRLVRPVRGWLVEDLVLGFAIGAALAVPTQVASVASGVGAFHLLIPLGVAALVLAVPAARRRVLSRETESLPRLWGLAVTACSTVPLLSALEAFSTPIRFRGWALPYVDVPYHQALAGEVLNRFPPHYPQTALEPLTYHWFVHAWTAQVSSVSGTSLDVLLWRFNPSVLVVAVPLLTAVAAMRLSGRVWVGPAASAIAYLLLDVAPWSASPLATPLHSPMSPTQQFGLMIFLAVLVVIALRWRRELPPAGVLLLVPLMVVAGGSKGSTLPVLVAGGLLACLVMLLTDRSRLRLVALDTALALVVMVVLNRFMFGGGSGGVRLNWLEGFVHSRGETILGPGVDASSASGIAAASLGLLALLLGYAGIAGLLSTRESRVDPLAWLLIGCGISGVCALLFLAHPGQAQWYFYKTAEAPLAIAAAWGTAVVLARARASTTHLALGAGAGVVALGVIHLVFVRGHSGDPGLGRAALALGAFLAIVVVGAWLASRRHGLFTTVAVAAVAVAAAGAVPAAEGIERWSMPPTRVSDELKPSAIHSSDVRALRWLRDHSDVDDVVMTNQHCRGRSWDQCDRRRFYIGAYAERRVLIEGWAYTREASKAFDPDGSLHYSQVPFWDQDLLDLNDGFVTAPTAEGAAELWDLGVRWVVITNLAPRAATLTPYAEARHATQYLTIYELLPVDE